MFLTLLATALASTGIGAIRLKFAKDAFSVAKQEDERIQQEAACLTADLNVLLSRIGTRVLASRDLLREAQRILQARELPPPLFVRSTSEHKQVSLTKAETALLKHDSLLESFAGVAVGPVLAAGAWASVSMLGIASTGTAIGTLHGVALSNATLAWFGGGSLASGGGGMIAGKVLLAKICIVPAAIYLTYKTFSKASEYDEATEKIHQCNRENLATIRVIEDRYRQVCPLESLLEREEDALKSDIEFAKRKLFRFGFMSKVWRWLRVAFGHSYYKEAELPYLLHLENSVLRFFATFNTH